MLQRFLPIITLALMLCMVPGLAQPGVAQPVTDPGVVSYTFRHQFQEDVPGTLDLIKEMGFTHIEFSNLFGLKAAEMRQLLDERGLKCTSYGVSYADLVARTDEVAADARALGARHVRVAWIPHEAPFDEADVRRAAADFNRAGSALREKGLLFSYHNHGYEFSPHDDGTLFDLLAARTDAASVGFEIDVFWVAYPGYDPVALLRRYPDRVRLLHLKDLKEGVDGDASGSAPSAFDVPLGTGQIDFPALLEAAADSAVEYMYIEDESDDVITRVPQSRSYLLSLTP
ncbi:MAG: sugar phosphate isomerase/epimerase family protein [Bacteroidota bacterium]